MKSSKVIKMYKHLKANQCHLYALHMKCQGSLLLIIRQTNFRMFPLGLICYTNSHIHACIPDLSAIRQSIHIHIQSKSYPSLPLSVSQHIIMLTYVHVLACICLCFQPIIPSLGSHMACIYTHTYFLLCCLLIVMPLHSFCTITQPPLPSSW